MMIRTFLALLAGGLLASAGARAQSPEAQAFARVALEVCIPEHPGGAQDLLALAGPKLRVRQQPYVQLKDSQRLFAFWATLAGDKDSVISFRTTESDDATILGYASQKGDRCGVIARGVPDAALALHAALTEASGWRRTETETRQLGELARLFVHLNADGVADRLLFATPTAGPRALALAFKTTDIARPSTPETMKALLVRLVAACGDPKAGPDAFAWADVKSLEDGNGLSGVTRYPDPPGVLARFGRAGASCLFVPGGFPDDAALYEGLLAGMAAERPSGGAYRILSPADGAGEPGRRVQITYTAGSRPMMMIKPD
jgi:hypothetical protein